jgi:predicted nuclease of predicted toxin-antitoxin system
MRFLIDNALSPLIADGLRAQGHDAVHVRDIGLAAAPDEEVFGRALAEHRIIVSADTDFGMILTLRAQDKPSLILFRHTAPRQPSRQIEVLAHNLPALEGHLDSGCVVSIEATRIRIRMLPMGG